MKGKDSKLLQLAPVPQLQVQKQTFWSYLEHPQNDIESLQNYLTNNQSQINQQQFPQPPLNIYDAYTNIAQFLQIQPHISLQKNKLQQSESLIEQSQPGDSGQQLQYLLFHNTKIDSITLKLLNFVWNQCPNLQVLKIFNSNLNKSEVEEVANLVVTKNVTKFFIEFIKTEESNMDILLQQLPKSVQLAQLFLRGNNLQCRDIQILFDSLDMHSSVSNLKFLELTSNHIGKQGLNAIASFLKKQNKIEYLGLAKNNVNNWEDVRELSETLMKRKLSPEELQAHRDLEAQREAQLKLNAKSKKKPIEETPLVYLEPLVQNLDGS